jgi:hypothetical protein
MEKKYFVLVVLPQTPIVIGDKDTKFFPVEFSSQFKNRKKSRLLRDSLFYSFVRLSVTTKEKCLFEKAFFFFVGMYRSLHLINFFRQLILVRSANGNWFLFIFQH